MSAFSVSDGYIISIPVYPSTVAPLSIISSEPVPETLIPVPEVALTAPVTVICELESLFLAIIPWVFPSTVPFTVSLLPASIAAPPELIMLAPLFTETIIPCATVPSAVIFPLFNTNSPPTEPTENIGVFPVDKIFAFLSVSVLRNLNPALFVKLSDVFFLKLSVIIFEGISQSAEILKSFSIKYSSPFVCELPIASSKVPK